MTRSKIAQIAKLLTSNTYWRTLNSEHQTPNTKHETRNTKHEAPNTKHKAPNTKHQTRKHQTRNTKHEAPNTKAPITKHQIKHKAPNTKHQSQSTNHKAPNIEQNTMKITLTQIVALSAAALMMNFAPGSADRVDVDVQYAFHRFAHSFCTDGEVKSADIGNGNVEDSKKKRLLLDTKSLPFEESSEVVKTWKKIAENPTAFGLKHALNEDNNLRRGLANGSECDESVDSCQTIGSKQFWCNYEQYPCMGKYSEIENMTYNLRPVKVGKPWVFDEWINNEDPKNAIESVFSKSEKVTNSYSWGLSVTVALGIKQTLTVGVPGVAEESLQISLDVSTTASESQTKTREVAFTTAKTIHISPNSTQHVVVMVKKAVYDGSWSAQLRLPDYARVWCSKKTQGHYEWFIPASQFMPVAYPKQCNGQYCNITGSFDGAKGVEVNTTSTSCPLFTKCK